MTLEDVILITCGGAAARIIKESEEFSDTDVLCLDLPDRIPDAPTTEAVLSHPDHYGVYSMILDRGDEITARLSGKRIVMLFAVLGGSAGTGMLPAIAELARDAGCSVVTVVGLPLEEARRRIAMDALDDVMSSSDRLMMFDIVSMSRIFPDFKIHRIMNYLTMVASFSIRNLLRMTEGPFFSTFSQKIYTMAYTSDIQPSDAVAKATEVSMFKVDPSFGKSVVLVSSGFGTAQIESIFATVVSMTGIVPDIVKRDDLEDTKVLTFLPVQGF